MTTRVFLSYSRIDLPFAEMVVNALRQHFEIFIDRDELKPGENWIGRLGMEIRSRDCVVVILSNASIHSQWVQDETGYARHINKPIIPLLLENIKWEEMEHLFYLASTQNIDFTQSRANKLDTAALNSLINAITEVGKSAQETAEITSTFDYDEMPLRIPADLEIFTDQPPAKKLNVLEIIRGRDQVGARYVELGTVTCIIGREEVCQVRINNPAVSRHHCKIYSLDDTHHVQDLNSTNGTLMNGERLGKGVTAELVNGDTLMIAGIMMIYRENFGEHETIEYYDEDDNRRTQQID